MSLNYQTGYIIHSKNYSNTSNIVSIFSENSIQSGIVKGSRTKNRFNDCNIGNKVSFNHFGREGSLGIFAIEVISNPTIKNISNTNIILAIFAASELISIFVNESFGEYNSIYKKFDNFINNLLTSTSLDYNKKSHQYLKDFYEIEKLIVLSNGYNTDNSSNIDLQSIYLTISQYKKILSKFKDSCLKNNSSMSSIKTNTDLIESINNVKHTKYYAQKILHSHSTLINYLKNLEISQNKLYARSQFNNVLHNL